MGGAPLWRGTAQKADVWRSELGASEYIARQVRFGILDMPSVPFEEGLIFGELPQGEEDRAFAREDLKRGCEEGVYEWVCCDEVRDLVRGGKMVSSAFTVW